eukprot:2373888-Rhodomonas_salina.1
MGLGPPIKSWHANGGRHPGSRIANQERYTTTLLIVIVVILDRCTTIDNTRPPGPVLGTRVPG